MMRTILEISHEVSTIFQGFSRTNIHAVAATDTPEIVYENPFFCIGYDINGEYWQFEQIFRVFVFCLCDCCTISKRPIQEYLL